MINKTPATEFEQASNSSTPTSKLGRYILYAFGEIVLVMIGILLALQVNNWNEARKKKITEKEVLTALNSEFKAAKSQIEGLNKLLKGRTEKLSTLSENCSLGRPSISLEKMDSLIWGSYALPSFNPPDGTLSDLLNSGKFDVIKNEELRKLLSEWNGNLETVKLQETLQGEFLYNRYTPFIEERVEFKHPRFERLMRMDAAESFEIDSRILLKDVKFCNLVRRSIYFNIFVNGYYDFIEKDIDQIIKLTEKDS
jgi:type II secretory pathway pseudopilin PulG